MPQQQRGGGNRPFRCGACTHPFVNQGSLSNHIRFAHPTHEAALQRLRVRATSSTLITSTSSSTTTTTSRSSDSSESTSSASTSTSTSSSSSSSSTEIAEDDVGPPAKKKTKRCGAKKRRHYPPKTKWVRALLTACEHKITIHKHPKSEITLKKNQKPELFLISEHATCDCCCQAIIQAFLQGGQSQQMRKKLCEDHDITTAMLGSWLSKQDEIRAKVAESRTLKLFKVTKRSARFKRAEDELERRFKERRGRGRRVSQRWFFATMAQLVKDMYPGVPFVASRGWLRRCCQRLGIAMRAKSNCKRAAAIERIPAIRQWLARYRAMLSTPLSASMPMDKVWGRFRPERRFNCDQVQASTTVLCWNSCGIVGDSWG